MPHGIIWLTFFSLFSSTLYGGTMIELRDRAGRGNQILADGNRIRVDPADRNSYVIIDHVTQSVKIVHPQRRTVLELSGEIPAFGIGGSAAENTALTIEDDGDGPDIAGYETRQYRLSVNGEYCGIVFTSKEAFEDAELDRLVQTVRKVTGKAAQTLVSMQSGMTACQRAAANSLDHIADIGAPLRSLDQNGKVDFEVTRIQTHVELAPDTFGIPQGYKLVNAAEKIKQVEVKIRTGIGKLLKKMPEMQKMLGDMEKAAH